MRTAVPAPRAGRAVAVALLGLLLAACAAEERPPRSAPEAEAAPSGSRSELTAVPRPPLGRLEEAAREALGDARSELEAALGRPAIPDAELGRSYGELGMLYLAYRLLEPAEACFRNARALSPDELRWSYYLGRVQLAGGRAAEARESFERAAELAPGHLPTLTALGELYLAEGRLEAAGERFADALAVDGASAAPHAGLGRVAVERRDPEAAIRHFEAALSAQPDASSLHYPLALAHRDLGDLESSREHLARRGAGEVALADPLMDEVRSLAAGARVHLLRAGSALADGELERGAAELRRAVAAEPGNADARLTLGAVLAERGKSGAAREQFLAAQRADPEDARAPYNLGVLALEEGAAGEAVRHLEAARERDPRHEGARFWLAVALIREDRHAAARTELTESLAVLPESARITHLLARLLAASPDPAVRDGERALELAAGLAQRGGVHEGRLHADLGQTLAMAYAEVGELDKAAALQRALIETMERDRRTERLPWLRANLARYEGGEPYRAVRPEEDPILSPPPSGAGGQPR